MDLNAVALRVKGELGSDTKLLSSHICGDEYSGDMPQFQVMLLANPADY